jgi:hypothetical protein
MGQSQAEANRHISKTNFGHRWIYTSSFFFNFLIPKYFLVLAYYGASTKIDLAGAKKEKEGIVIPYCRFLLCFGLIAIG